jgi:hypothetical protein
MMVRGYSFERFEVKARPLLFGLTYSLGESWGFIEVVAAVEIR